MAGSGTRCRGLGVGIALWLAVAALAGGFLAAPVWHLYELDVAAYAGGPFHVQFDFSSNDNLYNGFRGLMIDAVSVQGLGC